MQSVGKARGIALIVMLLLLAAWLQGEGPQTNFGYTPNPDGTAEFLAELDRPLFSDAGRDAIQRRAGRDTFLYRAAYAAHQAKYGTKFTPWKQSIGDCVSFGWGISIYIAQAVDWHEGLLEEPPLLVATESIYGGSRVEARGKDGSGARPVGGYSDGSYGGAAARWCRDWGVVFREPQANGIDLTTYSGSKAKSWGAYGNGGQGDAGRLDAEAKRKPCRHVALVRTFDEAAAAIESGFPVAVCSSVGFTSTRDSQGFCRRSGTWMHCMAFISVRYGDRPGLLCQNSWGNYVKGPKWPEDQPDGSFWVDRSTVDAMLRGGDSFAVGSVEGFGWRDLHHGDWLDENRR